MGIFIFCWVPKLSLEIIGYGQYFFLGVEYIFFLLAMSKIILTPYRGDAYLLAMAKKCFDPHK